MAAPQWTAGEIRRRLELRLAEGQPIVGFGVGCGMSACAAEAAGADYINIYATAVCRMKGLPSLLSWLPYGDVNQMTLEAGREILPLIRRTPVLAGIGAHDPRLCFPRLMEQLKALGFSGVSNEPFICQYGSDFAEKMEALGMGFSREAALIETAHQADLFAFGWVSTPAEAEAMARAGADALGVMARLSPEERSCSAEERLEFACRRTEEMVRSAQAVNPALLFIAHGDALESREAIARVLSRTGAHGYATGSDGERLPAISAIRSTVEALHGLSIHKERIDLT